MPYTRHGWWHGDDDPTEPPPQPPAPCGGPSRCPDCALDAHRSDQGATLSYTPIYTGDPTTVGNYTITPTTTVPGAMPFTVTVPPYVPPRPVVGAHVHYVAHGTPIRADGSQAFPSVCRAATVTETHSDAADDTVGLAVLNPTGVFFHPLGAGGARHVEPDEGPLEGGTWHWHWSHP